MCILGGLGGFLGWVFSFIEDGMNSGGFLS